ncbi:hypothetical protein HPQ32_08995 [Photobacterium carnosum]|uniref:Uncharacterized protein n=2 Tax=Photobacterium carnosum TaxID=2023717 RepID=A0A2N4UT06_9GAMM|nr:hypothetical protein [Photobacterium carnosum]MCD9493403.1 hypothetical protein [Photobacterium carnosum]MCD9524333.1 hypothetical protein [Photobacterium carnosum]MCD9529216.1 hypothetical protein [Photobacterium carnosum]MCD9533805.1 hypothetical protein [Photobacterium carnosum]
MEWLIMHKRMSCKRVKQMMADIGVNDNHHDDGNQEQLLLEQKEQAVGQDKQLIKLDSESK